MAYALKYSSLNPEAKAFKPRLGKVTVEDEQHPPLQPQQQQQVQYYLLSQQQSQQLQPTHGKPFDPRQPPPQQQQQLNAPSSTQFVVNCQQVAASNFQTCQQQHQVYQSLPQSNLKPSFQYGTQMAAKPTFVSYQSSGRRQTYQQQQPQVLQQPQCFYQQRNQQQQLPTGQLSAIPLMNWNQVILSNLLGILHQLGRPMCYDHIINQLSLQLGCHGYLMKRLVPTVMYEACNKGYVRRVAGKLHLGNTLPTDEAHIYLSY